MSSKELTPLEINMIVCVRDISDNRLGRMDKEDVDAVDSLNNLRCNPQKNRRPKDVRQSIWRKTCSMLHYQDSELLTKKAIIRLWMDHEIPIKVFDILKIDYPYGETRSPMNVLD